MSSIAKNVRHFLETIPEGEVITFADFQNFNVQSQQLALILSRLARSGFLRRVGKGRYYRPRQSKFGALPPSDSAVLKSFLSSPGQDDKIAYLSGLAAYNRMGLTTQIPNEFLVMVSGTLRNVKLGKLSIRCRPMKKDFKKEDFPLLPVLDALKDIRKIPDSNPFEIYKKITDIVNALNRDDKRRLVGLARSYRPYVRALLGMILQQKKGLAKDLYLNPLTKIHLGPWAKDLPGAKEWGIV